MSKGSVNKVIIIGNCGQDPEVKSMPSGDAVTNISIATTEKWKDKATGQPTERADWHRVAFFNRLAEIAGEYLRKGSKVYVEGSLRTRKWQDQQGIDRYTTEIVAKEMTMLDSRAENTPLPAREQRGETVAGEIKKLPQQPHQPTAQPRQGYAQGGYPGHQMAPPPPNMDDFDDDIPFS